jgi:hypothetical protein
MKYKTGHEYINRLRVIFSALATAPLMVFFWVLLSVEKGVYQAPMPDLHGIGVYVAPIVGIGVSLVAYIIYYQKIKPVRKLGKLRLKLDQTYKLSLSKYFMLTFAATLVVVFFVLTGNKLYAGVTTVVYILLAMSNPVVGSIINDLRLPKPQKDLMRSNAPIGEED